MSIARAIAALVAAVLGELIAYYAVRRRSH
jgi:hypothetical protein